MATEYFNDAWRIPNNKNQSLVSNYSMEFDGTNDKIDFGDVNGFDITDKFSGSCWIYPTAVGSDYILGKEQSLSPFKGYMLYIDSNRKLRFIMAVQYSTNFFGLASSSAIPYNTWTHLAFTYDGSTNRTGLKLYINSVLQTVSYTGNSTISGSMLDSTVPFQISGRGGSATNGVNGKIDQVCIFDYALPATGTNSVATLYGGGTAVTNPMSLSPKPVAYYQLGDQSVDNGANYLVPNNSLQDYVFDFTPNDFIDCGDNDIFSFTNGTGTDLPFSLSAWVYMHDATGFRVISKYSTDNASPIEWFLYTTGSGILRFRLYDNGTTIGRGYSVAMTNLENQWINIVGTYNANELNSGLKIYINGSRVDDQDAGTGSGYQGMSNTINPVRIGRMGTGYADGEFSNVSIFNTELSTAQVEAIYNNGTPNDISSLSPIAWWKLNAADTFDGTNWTINDYAGSNNGTSSSMTSANLVQSNLQHTSGYSPWAIELNGTDQLFNCGNDSSLQITGAMTVSYWFKGQGGSGTSGGVGKLGNTGSRGFLLGITSSGNITFFIAPTASSLISAGYSHTTDTNWHHIVGVFNPSTSLELYFDGQLVDTTPTSTSSQYNAVNNLQIGARGDSTGFFDGQLSNVAIWSGTTLSSTEVTEVYNQGVPSNLNTFSGTKPTAWWQLGSNSSFNATTSQWTCLDEIGTNNAVSLTNMTNDDITNGPGYSANGLGTSSIEIVGDAPYSTANGISENMDVLDRTTDVPS